jgi:hypothetical protein
MTLADIARAADVPVESVLRVLHHDEVSSDVAERVRDAMAAYTQGAGVDALLRRLAQDVDELKLELRRAQSERLEDLTLLVDLLTTSWRAVDRRLEAMDRKLDRIEGQRPRLP